MVRFLALLPALCLACSSSNLVTGPTGSTSSTGTGGTTSSSTSGATSTGSSGSTTSSTSGAITCAPSSITTYPFQAQLLGGFAAGPIFGAGGTGASAPNDLVVSAGPNGLEELTFFENDGGGGFTRNPTVLELDAGPNNALAGVALLADFNGDGIEDLAVCDFGSAVWIALGLGGGAFAPAALYPVPCFWMAPVNTSGTSRLDLAVVNGSTELYPDGGVSAFMTVLLNDGGGGFADSLTLVANTNLSSIAAGDLNGDGFPDLVAVGDDNVNGYIEVYFNDRDGGFVGPVDTAGTSWGGEVAVGDVTGDGRPDVVLINYPGGGEPGIVIYTNVDGGQLSPGPLLASRADPEDAVIVDLNGDGKADIALVGPKGLKIWLQGDAGFSPPTMLYDAGGYFVSAADLNGDGHPDLAVSGGVQSSSWVTVVLDSCR